MSKVVHLSDVAHARAKGHCQRAGLKMSEWVAVLIERAIDGQPAASLPRAGGSNAQGQDQVQGPPQELASSSNGGGHAAAAASVAAASVAKKTVVTLEGHPDTAGENSVPLYAAPPFWASSRPSTLVDSAAAP